MKIKVNKVGEAGADTLFEGSLNKDEVAFLLNYAINDLVAAGVMFNLDEPDDDEDNPNMRIKWPEGSLN